MSFFYLGTPPHNPPERVVSLVPSLTESLQALGCQGLLVGRTDYCPASAQVAGIPSVGGTKTFRLERVLQNRPELVLAAKEENPRRLVEELAQQVPVLVVDPEGPEDVPAIWRELGRVLGAQGPGEALAVEVEQAWAELAAGPAFPQVYFVYFVWARPWMAAGPNTYVGHLLQATGLVNAVPAGSRRYPQLSQEQALAAEVRLHFYPDEPYAFSLPQALELWGEGVSVAAAGAALQAPLEGEAASRAFLLDGRILCLAVSGAALTWYPSRTAEGLRLARELAHVAARWLATAP